MGCCNGLSRINERFDRIIRCFFYILIFWIPYSVAVVEVCVGVSCLLWICKRIVYGVKSGESNVLRIFKPVSNVLNWPIVFYLGICFISAIQSADFTHSVYNLITKTSEPFVIYLIFIEVFKSKKQLLLILAILLFTTFSTALDGLYQYYISGEDIFLSRPLSKGPRATASFTAPNGLGAYLLIGITITVSLFGLKNRSKSSWFVFAFILSVLLWAMILTFSRGAWLSLWVGLNCLILLFMFLLKVKVSRIIGTAVLSICVIFGAFQWYMSSYDKYNSINRSLLSWRLQVWSYTTDLIKEKPIFGHGINTYMPLLQKHRSQKRGVEGTTAEYNPNYAHNCYLQIATEVGIVGLLSFLAILMAFYQTVFKRVWLSFRTDYIRSVFSIGIMCGITAFLFHAFFDTHFYSLQLSSYLWFMMGMQMVITKIDFTV